MALLFVGGVMNLLWIAAIAILVLLEKTIPFGDIGGRVVGATMILIGALSLALCDARFLNEFSANRL